MNAETLMVLPDGARLAVKIAMSAEMSKVRTLHTAIFALAVYDTISTLPAEYENVWSKKKSLMTLPYLVCRYFFPMFHAGIISLERWGASYEACKAVVRFTNVPPIITFVAASILFIERIHALFDRDRRVSLPLYALLAGVLAVQIRTVAMTRANELPSLLGIPACVPAPGNSWFLAYHGVMVGFDAIVVVLTLLRVYQLHRQSRSHLVTVILRDTVFWFSIVLASALANMIYFTVAGDNKNPALLGPLAIMMESIAAARFMLGLREAASSPLSFSGLSNAGRGIPLTPTTPVSPWTAVEMPASLSSGKHLAPPRSPLANGFLNKTEANLSGRAF